MSLEEDRLYEAQGILAELDTLGDVNYVPVSVPMLSKVGHDPFLGYIHAAMDRKTLLSAPATRRFEELLARVRANPRLEGAVVALLRARGSVLPARAAEPPDLAALKAAAAAAPPAAPRRRFLPLTLVDVVGLLVLIAGLSVVVFAALGRIK